MNTINNTDAKESIKNLKSRIKMMQDQPEPHLFLEAISCLQEEIASIQETLEPEPFHHKDGTLITCCDKGGNMPPELEHCFIKISDIVCPHIRPWYIDKVTQEIVGGGSDFEPLKDKHLLQLGYNLGRIAEITGWGRAVWDRLKGPVEARDWAFVQLQMGFLSNYATGLARTIDDD